MACEDAATLRRSLQGANRETIMQALLQYQKLRKPRVSVVQKAGRALQGTYHLQDGEEQRQRDCWITRDDPKNPVFWGCKARCRWLFGHDAELL